MIKIDIELARKLYELRDEAFKAGKFNIVEKLNLLNRDVHTDIVRDYEAEYVKLKKQMEG